MTSEAIATVEAYVKALGTRDMERILPTSLQMPPGRSPVIRP